MVGEKTVLKSATKQVLNETQISIVVKIFHSWIPFKKQLDKLITTGNWFFP